MFFDSSAQVVIGDNGRLATIRVALLVDELNTLYILTQLGVGGHGQLSEIEKRKVESSVYKGFSDYDFFTHLADQNGEIALPRGALDWTY